MIAWRTGYPPIASPLSACKREHVTFIAPATCISHAAGLAGRRTKCSRLCTCRLVAAANYHARAAIPSGIAGTLDQIRRLDRLGLRLRLVGLQRILALYQHASIWWHAGTYGRIGSCAAGNAAWCVFRPRYRPCCQLQIQTACFQNATVVAGLSCHMDAFRMAARLGADRFPVGGIRLCTYRQPARRLRAVDWRIWPRMAGSIAGRLSGIVTDKKICAGLDDRDFRSRLRTALDQLDYAARRAHFSSPAARQCAAGNQVRCRTGERDADPLRRHDTQRPGRSDRHAGNRATAIGASIAGRLSAASGRVCHRI